MKPPAEIKVSLAPDLRQLFAAFRTLAVLGEVQTEREVQLQVALAELEKYAPKDTTPDYRPTFEIVPCSIDRPEYERWRDRADQYTQYFEYNKFSVVDEFNRPYGSFETEQKARAKIDHLNWEWTHEVGRRIGSHLDDARTVHSRAQTAVAYASRQGLLDPEEAQVYEDLKKVVALLDRWKRIGRLPKRKS